MLIPHFLSLFGSNFIWSILGKLFKLVGVLYHRHLSLDQVVKLDILGEHRPYGYKESVKGLSKLLPSELCIGLEAGTVVMPPMAGCLLKLMHGKAHFLRFCALQ